MVPGLADRALDAGHRAREGRGSCHAGRCHGQGLCVLGLAFRSTVTGTDGVRLRVCRPGGPIRSQPEWLRCVELQVQASPNA
eukprot:792544-Rhodomonas_salina.7